MGGERTTPTDTGNVDLPRGCCVPPKKKKGGGGGSAQSQRSTRCASKWQRPVSAQYEVRLKGGGGGSAQSQRSTRCASKWQRPVSAQYEVRLKMATPSPQRSTRCASKWQRPVSAQYEVRLKMATPQSQRSTRCASKMATASLSAVRGAPQNGNAQSQRSTRCASKWQRPVSAQYEVAPQNGNAQSQRSTRCASKWRRPETEFTFTSLMALPHRNKKNWSNKKSGAEHIWTEDQSVKNLQSIHLGYLSISESTNAGGKNRSNRVDDRHRVHGFQSGKTRCTVLEYRAWIHLNTAKFSLFACQLTCCCHWCWSMRSRNCPDPLKNRKSDPRSLTRIA